MRKRTAPLIHEGPAIELPVRKPMQSFAEMLVRKCYSRKGREALDYGRET